MAIVTPLAACGTRGFSLEDAVPDRSIVTGSIPPRSSQPGGDTTATSDEATIRNAVSSVIVDEVGEGGVGWENAETGSRGAISEIREAKRDGYLCRSFSATRESFDGVSLYRGETCLTPGRSWVIHAFEKVE